MSTFKPLKTLCFCLCALTLSACNTFHHASNGEAQCWPGTACWKQLSPGQQDSKRSEWLASRQDMLNDKQTMRSHAFSRINPVSTS